MQRRVSLTAALLLLVALTGCDTVKEPGRVVPDELSLDQYPQMVAQGGLGGWLRSPGARVIPAEGDKPMEIVVPIRSVNDRAIYVQYQFEFFDAQGRPLSDQPSWRFMDLPSRVQKFMTANALTTDAVAWRLTVRPSR